MTDHTQNPSPHLSNAEGDVSAYGFDTQELKMLALCRRLFEAMSGQDQQIWAAAYRLAGQHYGGGGAERILGYTVDVIEAMRALRSSPFIYGRDGCACCRNKLTQEERLLIASFHNMRRGKRSRAYVQAMLLVEGRDPARLVVALEMLDFALFEGREVG